MNERQTLTETKLGGPPPPTGLYQWRDRTGRLWHPGEMETRHLFHTVSMIWNHHMPVKTRPDYRHYTFSEFYSDWYLQLSARMLVRELFHRDDLEPYMKASLDMMHSYLVKNDERYLEDAS